MHDSYIVDRNAGPRVDFVLVCRVVTRLVGIQLRERKALSRITVELAAREWWLVFFIHNVGNGVQTPGSDIQMGYAEAIFWHLFNWLLGRVCLMESSEGQGGH